jgi:hypothetical protein
MKNDTLRKRPETVQRAISMSELRRPDRRDYDHALDELCEAHSAYKVVSDRRALLCELYESYKPIVSGTSDHAAWKDAAWKNLCYEQQMLWLLEQRREAAVTTLIAAHTAFAAQRKRYEEEAAAAIYQDDDGNYTDADGNPVDEYGTPLEPVKVD